VIIMPRISPCLKAVSLCLLAYGGLAFAQQPAQQPAPQQQAQQPAQQPPSDKPPKLERVEPGSEIPATTLPSRAGTQIKEKKQGGVVTEVEVRAGGSHYYMKPNVPAGNAQPGDVQSSAIHPPQWKVLEFDLNRKRKEAGATEGPAENAPAPATAPAPPPPATK
jgi:hypothetical protein